MNAADSARISAEIDALHPWPASEQGGQAPAEPQPRDLAARVSAALDVPDAPHVRSQLTDARNLPRTLDEATQSLAIVEESYAESVDTFMTAFAGWQRADALQARIRVQCARDLARPVGETEHSLGLSPNQADKQASDHPSYTRHKDHVAELALNKAEAEADRDLLLQSLKNQRAILYALIAREGVSPRAKPETVLDRQRTVAFMSPEDRDELRAILDGHADEDAIATGQREREQPSRGDLSAHDTLDEKRGRN